MAVMHTTTMRANMTAYSTAVGPSSFFKKLTKLCPNLRMRLAFLRRNHERNKATGGRIPHPVDCILHRMGCLRATTTDSSVQRDIAEGIVGIAAQGRDSRDADHNNEGQHDGVLDRGWAIFLAQEAYSPGDPLVHNLSPFPCSEVTEPAQAGRDQPASSSSRE